MKPARTLACLIAVLTLSAHARAIVIKVSAQALERTLNQQLFTGADGRYYIRGGPGSACYTYAYAPKVSFKDERIVVHVKTSSKLGAAIKGSCFGVGLATESDVSVVPDAQGESIGFRDPRLERLSDSKELNFLIEPFLAKQLPQKMRINAAELIRQLLQKSAEATGYEVRLDNLKIHSMLISGDALIVDFDGDLSVR
jgi:hypothetical protein